MIKGTELLERNFVTLLEALSRIGDYYIALTFTQLIFAIKGTTVFDEYFQGILNLLSTLNNSDSKSEVLSDLILEVEDSELLEKNFIPILNIIEKINGEYNKMRNFDALTRSIKIQGDRFELIKERFPDYKVDLEEMIKKQDHS